MRRYLVAISASALALSGAPALAQHGGSPDYQLDDDYADEAAAKETFEVDDPGDVVGDRRRPLSEHKGEAADFDRDEDHDDDHDIDRDVDRDHDTWRGDDGRLYCRRSDGTTGTIIGGGAGALIGRGIDTRGERGTGTILGAVAGALLGRAIERGARCR